MTLLIAIMIGGLISFATYVTCVVGPLWPVGRLYYLSGHDDMLVHEGVGNPRAQRMFSAVALGCLLALGACALFAPNNLRWHTAEMLVVGLYLWLTYVVFEWHLWAAVKEIGLRLLGLVLALVSTSTNKEEENDDTATEPPTAEDRKMAVGNAVGIICVGAFAFTAIYIALYYLFGRLFH
jgi:hypothetical protein